MKHEMEKIPMEDVSRRLPEILERVAHGEHFAITQDGEDRAEIRPTEEAEIRRARTAADTIRELRKSIQPLGLPVREAIEDGRP